jgi:hypothetical protein
MLKIPDRIILVGDLDCVLAQAESTGKLQHDAAETGAKI